MTKLKWFRIHAENERHVADCSLPAEDFEDAKNKFRQDHPMFGRSEFVIEEIRDYV